MYIEKHRNVCIHKRITYMMDRRFRESRKAKLRGWGNPDLKMPSSTIEKFEGGTSTTSFSCSSNISPIASLSPFLFVYPNKKAKTEGSSFLRRCEWMQEVQEEEALRGRIGGHGFRDAVGEGDEKRRRCLLGIRFGFKLWGRLRVFSLRVSATEREKAS